MAPRKLTGKTSDFGYAIALSLLVVLGMLFMAAVPALFGVFRAGADVSFALLSVSLGRIRGSKPPTARKAPYVA